MSNPYDLSQLGQTESQELHRDRVSRVYLGEASDAETQRRTIARIDWIVENCSYGDVLDIGCSEGIFEVKAVSANRRITAIDIHPDAIRYAQEFFTRSIDDKLHGNVDFQVCSFFDVDNLSPIYNSVVLGEVIEHVHQPKNMLMRAALSLKHGGRMLITTPWGYFPAPDHHQTFFLNNFLNIIPDIIKWNHLSVVDGYIRFLGTKAAKPGSAAVERMRVANERQFNAAFLLGATEKAALESQQFLRQVLDYRTQKWTSANETARQLKISVEEHARARGDLAKAEEEHARAKADLAKAEKAALNKLAAEKDALSKQLEATTGDRDTLRKQNARLERSKGDVPLAIRTAARRKVIPIFARARAYVEARPALKARLLRALPKSTMQKLQKYGRTAIRETTSREPKELLQDYKVPEGHELIVVCNTYPDGSGQYGGEFIRARLNGYRDRGVKCLVVVCNHRYAKPHLVAQEGIDVFRVPMFLAPGALEFAAQRNAHTIFVHSPSPESIEELRELSKRKRVVMWFHGFEVRDYRRLLFNFSTEDLERQRQFLDSTNRSRLSALRSLDSAPEIRTVFVSNFQLDIARNDSGASLRNASIIHNFIDGNFFSFKEKAPAMAKRILLIRSFQNRNYANDIATGALLLLAQQPNFKELKITIRGTGRYFRELTEPLAQFGNVDLAETYLSAQDVKKLHNDHGIFLVPSRFDTQGVSMCEAMASGLVCITNPVAAIPEFFDESCGYLAKPDSVEAYAEAISNAVANPAQFSSKSNAAANRAREQCSASKTIERELAFLEE